VEEHIKELGFRDGALISATLGKGNEGANYVLRKAHERPSWPKRLLSQRSATYGFSIEPRDDAGARALTDLKDRGTNLAANALAQATDHIQSFFSLLRSELAFYVGCLNLHDQLAPLGVPVCFPAPADRDERRHTFADLYDICLALTVKRAVVSNSSSADDKDVFIITGANQGGKSTFLRSIGLAQVMMQCGMFVAAESFAANVADGIFTHYNRQEDATMQSGKLEEELGRMSDIVDHLAPHSLVLLNEAFAATNEREGSEIARQITIALMERHVKVFFVTHLYEFAHGLYDEKLERMLFMRAERKSDGSRTYRVVEGRPLKTSYGMDLYRRIFGG
jgi:DNA mismatch repair ATPase MutS